MAEEKQDEVDKNSEPSASSETKGNLTAPEGILMLCVAGLLDSLGLIFFCFSWLGMDDYGVLDIIGAIIIGGWLFIRKGKGSSSRAIKRLLIAFGIEAVPFLGGISPSWIILVWKELRS